MDTTSKRLTEYTIDADTSVAVVVGKQLTELERSILPSDYETVDPFTEESFNYPPFRILDSPAAIVDAVLHTVTPENANDVAVVLDAASQYSSLIESALEAADIPYYGGPGFTDNSSHRAFLQLLRHAHAGRDTRVGDVRPLLVQLGLVVDIEHDEKRLRDLDVPEIEWLLEFSADIEAHTLASALDKFETVTGSSLDAFREELERLGIQDDIVTEQAVDRLEFYLQSYEVPIDRENDGVLLADAKSAAYVGRPVVFYLGLDEDWTHSSPRRPLGRPRPGVRAKHQAIPVIATERRRPVLPCSRYGRRDACHPVSVLRGDPRRGVRAVQRSRLDTALSSCPNHPRRVREGINRCGC